MPRRINLTEKIPLPLKSLTRRKRRPPAGSAPGHLEIDPHAISTKLHLIHYTSDHLEEKQLEDISDVDAYRARPGILWLNVIGLGDQQILEELGRKFNLHPLALADVVHVDQRAKAEIHEEQLFLVLRMLHGGSTMHHEQVSIFLGSGFILTFQERDGDCFDMIRMRLRKPSSRLRQRGPDYLTYALLDAIIDAYFQPLESLGDQLDAIEELVLQRPNIELMQQLHVLKREMLVLRRAIWPVRETINILLRDDADAWISQPVKPFLRDCYDHTIQVMDMVETFRELAASQMELYISTVSQRTNETMKVLTMFAAIFIPLTFIAGVYGMNFDPDFSPWNMPEIQWYLGYPAVLLLMGIVAGSTLYYFHRRGWFDRG